MGGLFAKPTSLKITDVNNVTNKVILEFAPNNRTTGTATNIINVSNGGIASNNTQLIEMNQSLESLYDATQTTDFKNDINNTIKQELKKETVALISDIGSIFNDKNVNLDTALSNNIENINLTQIIPTCISNQTLLNTIVNDGGITSNNTQTIKSNFFQKCVGSVNSAVTSTSDITNMINQKADIIDNNPLAFIGDMFKGLMSTILIIIVIVVAGILVFFSGDSGTKKLEVITNKI